MKLTFKKIRTQPDYFPGYRVLADGKDIGDVARIPRNRKKGYIWHAYQPLKALPVSVELPANTLSGVYQKPIEFRSRREAAEALARLT